MEEGLTTVDANAIHRKLLIVAPAFWPSTAYGGPTDSITGTARAMRDMGMTVRVLTTDADGIASVNTPDGDPLGFRVTYSRRIGRRDVAPAIAPAIWRGTQWSDIVHVNGVFCFPSFPAVIAGRRFSKPVFWSARGALESANVSARSSFLKKSLFGLAKTACPQVTLHFTSTEEAEKSGSLVRGVRSVVIPNGVEVPESTPAMPGPGPLALLFVGRLHPIKALEQLLEALAIAVRRGTDARLTIAGTGDETYVAQLHQLVERLGISSRIDWVGFVAAAEKQELFSRAAVLALPSHSENFGRVVPEALAHGRTVITSRGTPWSEVEERGCGRWVENDPESLAHAIQTMAVADVASMGSRGREWVKERFSWEAVAKQMRAAYDDAIESARTWRKGKPQG